MATTKKSTSGGKAKPAGKAAKPSKDAAKKTTKTTAVAKKAAPKAEIKKETPKVEAPKVEIPRKTEPTTAKSDIDTKRVEMPAKEEVKQPQPSKTVFDSKQIDREVKLNFTLPDTKEMLKAGVQFGHRVRRRDPRMDQYIFGTKWDISIIDVDQTGGLLEKAAKFLAKASAQGPILLVGTKRQAYDLVKKEAIRSGANFIVNRWPGGLLSNFQLIKRSVERLKALEDEFEKGVVNRTKYEISRLKKEWERLNRLYAGIKHMDQLPGAVVIVDTNYERVALSEAKKLGIPVVSIVDTNTDPTLIDYPIPGNDDAIGSLELFLKVLGDAILQGNDGKGIKYEEKDYAASEVKIIKAHEEAAKLEEVK